LGTTVSSFVIGDYLHFTIWGRFRVKIVIFGAIVSARNINRLAGAWRDNTAAVFAGCGDNYRWLVASVRPRQAKLQDGHYCCGKKNGAHPNLPLKEGIYGFTTTTSSQVNSLEFS
jgi:hypothetical protein